MAWISDLGSPSPLFTPCRKRSLILTRGGTRQFPDDKDVSGQTLRFPGARAPRDILRQALDRQFSFYFLLVICIKPSFGSEGERLMA
jgi:hypothetical protein